MAVYAGRTDPLSRAVVAALRLAGARTSGPPDTGRATTRWFFQALADLQVNVCAVDGVEDGVRTTAVGGVRVLTAGCTAASVAASGNLSRSGVVEQPVSTSTVAARDASPFLMAPR
ncbi:hypothetical protein GCM10008944_09000 [Cytobacillus oceanisediminis]